MFISEMTHPLVILFSRSKFTYGMGKMQHNIKDQIFKVTQDYIVNATNTELVSPRVSEQQQHSPLMYYASVLEILPSNDEKPASHP